MQQSCISCGAKKVNDCDSQILNYLLSQTDSIVKRLSHFLCKIVTTFSSPNLKHFPGALPPNPWQGVASGPRPRKALSSWQFWIRPCHCHHH